MRPITSTYRLQFNRDFRFADAAALVSYFGQLGVSHLYASPIFAARPGSAHGYDMVDPTANCTFRMRPSWAFGLRADAFTGSPTRWVFQQ